MADTSFDLAIVGGGPGGYVAAIRAAQLGMKTALVEHEHLGGICLNWGCIPTKALLRSAEIYHYMTNADSFGLSVGEVGFDLGRVVKRSRDIAGRLSGGVRYLLKKHKVSVFDGRGRLAGTAGDRRKLQVEKDGNAVAELSASHVILASGARARELPGLESDGKLVWTYKHAMVPEALPKALLVVGSGAIGIEFASFYRALGAEVTVVEILPQVLPVEDEEIAALARKAFEGQGMKIITGATVSGLKKARGKVTASIEADGKSNPLTVDRVIMAVGIVGNIEELGLDGSQVRVDRGHVVIDQWMRTGEPGVYAIGDLVGPPWLAHKASHEGVICVDKIAGSGDAHPLDTGKIPGCTYSHPQIASIGLTERRAEELGHTVKVGRFPFVGNGKAIALGETEGMVKTVFDANTGELLGAHMVGTEVTELIQGYGLAMTLETTEAELMRAVFPHPTLSEMMHESVLDAYGKVIHF